MKSVIVTITVCLGFDVWGQTQYQEQYNYEDGFVVFSYGDTLRGRIKVRGGISDVWRYEVVKFLKDGQITEFKPREVKYYRVGNDRFESKNLGGKGSKLIFFKIITKGYCTLYESKVKKGVSYNAFGQAGPSIIHGLYLQREGEDLHPVNFSWLRQGRDLYFIDNIALTYDIRNRKYKADQLADIVKRYNKEWKAARERESKSDN